MKRTMVFLPDEIHEGLRRLAFDQKKSMAGLIREAVQSVYGEDIEDIRDAEAELASYRAAPDTAITLEELNAQRRASVRG